jgi:hypothetical protein
MADQSSGNTWLTVVLPIWIVSLAVILFQWISFRRYRKRWYRPEPMPEVVAAGRRLYDDGEFMRDIVKRSPRSLFGDAVELSCGHKSQSTRNDDATRTNCHECATEWIDRQSEIERKQQK